MHADNDRPLGRVGCAVLIVCCVFGLVLAWLIARLAQEGL